MRYVEFRRHTMRVKPGQHLSQAGVTLARRIGESIGPFQRVVTSPIPRAYETAIAMGFAVDRQDEVYSVLIGNDESSVEKEVGSWDAGFAAFAEAYKRGGLTAQLARMLTEGLTGIARSLSDDGAALVISHGGMIEAAAVGCLPGEDFGAWGRFCDYCEGARLFFDGNRFVRGEVLRVDGL